MSKGLMKFKRVALRMREAFGEKEFKKKDIEEAIFVEIGTDPRTVRASIDRMVRLKYIEKAKTKREFGVDPGEKYKLTEAQNEYF